jgi:cephalosporin hydroxylase
VEAIRAAPLEALRSAAWLEYEFLPFLGLNDLGTFPPHLKEFCGKGVKSWQWPNQFAPYLATLSARKIDSYMELGLFHGGTFIITVEYLRRFNPSVTAVGIDMDVKPGVRAYQEIAEDITIIEGNTRSAEALRVMASRIWGLVLVDGDHSEQGCWADYQAVRNFTRLAAFHDISNDVFPGVGAVWTRLAEAFPRHKTHEFISQYQDVIRHQNRIDYGIGLLEVQ